MNRDRYSCGSYSPIGASFSFRLLAQQGRTVYNLKAFSASGRDQPVIQADDLKACGASFSSQEGSGKLQGIRGTDVMDAEKAFGGDSDRLHWIDKMPDLGELLELLKHVARLGRGELAHPFEPRRRGSAFDLGAPPHGDALLVPEQGFQRFAGLLFNQERHQGRAVPESHRPLLRSSRSSCSTLAPSRATGRGRWKRSGPFDA